MAVYNVNENLTPVLLSAMHTCYVSFAGLGIGLDRGGLGFGLEGAGLGLGRVTVNLDYNTDKISAFPSHRRWPVWRKK